MAQFEDYRDTSSGIGTESEGLGSSSFDASRTAQEKAKAADKLGERLQGAAGRIRDTGPRIENIVHRATATIADRLEQGGSYLKEKKYQQTAGSVTSLMKQHPMASLLIGLAIGVILASGSRRH